MGRPPRPEQKRTVTGRPDLQVRDHDGEERHRRHRGAPLLVFALACSAVGFVAVLVATAAGPGMNADSAAYYSAGINLADGKGLIQYDGSSLTSFPPGMSLLIASAIHLGLSPDLVIRLANAVALSATIFLGYRILRRRVDNDIVVAAATFFLTVNVALLDIGKMALSECLFVFICVAFVDVSERGVVREASSSGPIDGPPVEDRSGGPVAMVVLLAILVWMGFAIRYAGVVLVPVGLLAVALALKNRSTRTKIRFIALYLCLALIGPMLIMLRNQIVNGNLMGTRTRSSDGLIDTVIRVAAIPGKWLLPDPIPELVQGIFGVLVITSLVVMTSWMSIRSAKWRNSILWSPFVVFVAVYYLYIVAAQITVAFDRVNGRLLSPALVPLVVLMAVAIDHIVSAIADRDSHRVPAVRSFRSSHGLITVGVMTSAVLLLQTVVFIADVVGSGRDGVDYASHDWHQSEVLALARELPPNAVLYSNTSAGVWIVLRRQPILKSPPREGRRTGRPMGVPEEFIDRTACEDSFLVWADQGQTDYLFTPVELAEFVEVTLVAESVDGSVYELGAKRDVDPSECAGSG